MRRMIVPVGLCAVFLGATAAWAQTSADEASARTERALTEQETGVLRKGYVEIKPQAGAIVFKDNLGSTTSRGAAGLTVDMNALKISTMDNPVYRDWFIGPSLGAIYSRIGETGANFFGTPSTGGSVASFLLIPTDLKIGYMVPNSQFRFAAHGGGNVMYRSAPISLNTGPNVATASGPQWSYYPNIGADLELGAFFIRPDYTFTPGNDVFSGTAGVTVAIG